MIAATSLARAQVADPSAPPVPVVREPRGVPDGTVEFTDEGQILYGKERRELTPVEFFQLTGRNDLVERAHANASLRRALLIGAGALALVTMTVGAVLLATAPAGGNTACNSGDNVLYNYYCQPQSYLHNWVGGVLLVAGLGISGAIATVGLTLRPEVLNSLRLQELIDQYNASLARPASVRLMPWLSPAGGGLVAGASF